MKYWIFCVLVVAFSTNIFSINCSDGFSVHPDGNACLKEIISEKEKSKELSFTQSLKKNHWVRLVWYARDKRCYSMESTSTPLDIMFLDMTTPKIHIVKGSPYSRKNLCFPAAHVVLKANSGELLKDCEKMLRRSCRYGETYP